jgi:cell division septation protein DedD
VASQIQDDGFHEIQLNGKQLVFLFMAATVVSVVIFLCGVLVGRGVRAERGGVAEFSTATSVGEPTPQPPAVAPAPPPAGSDPTAAAQPPAAGNDDLSYFDRLEKTKPPKEELKGSPQAQAPSSSRGDVREPAPTPKGTTATKETAATKEPSAPKEAAPVKAPARDSANAAATSSEPSGPGYAVQIAALNVRSEAEAIAKRLSSKGYSAYVLSPASGTPTVYRVRVGKFSTRREAESIAAKLQKEEQFKPWVTR